MSKLPPAAILHIPGSDIKVTIEGSSVIIEGSIDVTVKVPVSTASTLPRFTPHDCDKPSDNLIVSMFTCGDSSKLNVLVKTERDETLKDARHNLAGLEVSGGIIQNGVNFVVVGHGRPGEDDSRVRLDTLPLTKTEY